MSTSAQHEFHPDAELLNAFAEHVLDERERGQVFAHLAVCGRCRQVLALAQQAAQMDVEELVAAAAPAGVAATPRRAPRPRPWWSNWHFAWIPAAALAGTAAFAVYLHVARVERPPEMAQNSSSSIQSDKALPAPAPKPPAEPASPSSAPPSAPIEHRAREAAAPSSRRDADEAAKSVPLPAVATASPMAAPVPPPAPPPSATETVVVTPDSNAPQTTSAQQSARIEPRQLAQAEVLQSESAAASNALARKALKVESKAGPNEEVGSAQSASAQDNLALSAGSPSPRSPAATNKNSKKGTDSAAALDQQKANANVSSMARLGTVRSAENVSAFAAEPIRLPSGLPILSVASANHLMLALDRAGTLFLSRENEATWQQIPSQWKGRAILIRTGAPGAPPAVATSSAGVTDGVVAGGLPSTRSAATIFEIVNDEHQVWQSTDGFVWTRK